MPVTDLVPDEYHDHGGDVLVDVGRREQRQEPLKLLRQLQPEPPVALVIHLEEVWQFGQVLAPAVHVQQGQEVAQVLQHADAHLNELINELIDK